MTQPVAPLSDLRGVAVGDDIATRMTAKLLRSLGARIVRAGSPLPDRFAPVPSSVVEYLDRGASHLEGTLETALSDADIVIGAFNSPDAPETKTLEDLVASGAIVAQVTVWGERGPRADEAGDELIVQAATGVVNLIGVPGREPLVLGGQQIAYSAAMQLFTGIMIALVHRDRTGDGQFVRTSLIETAAYLEWKGATYYQADGTLLSRGLSTGPLVLPTRDGHVAFYYRDIDWPQVVDMFGDDRLRNTRFDTMPDRIAAEREIFEILAEHTRTRDKHDIYHAAQARGIPVGSVETVADLISDLQYGHQRFLTDVDDGERRWAEPLMPFTFNGTRFGRDARDVTDLVEEARLVR